MCVFSVLGIPSSEAPPFPIPDVPISVYGTTLVAWVSFWPLYFLLVPISPLYPPGLYSRLRCYWSPSGILPTSQLVPKCLYSFTVACFAHCFHIHLCVAIFSKPLLAALCLLQLPSHFSRVRLCDPIDGSPPGPAIPGILQARTLEWVAISSSKAWKWKMKVKSLSRVRLLATPWIAAYQAPPSMRFSRQEYWSGVPAHCVLIVKKLFSLTYKALFPSPAMIQTKLSTHGSQMFLSTFLIFFFLFILSGWSPFISAQWISTHPLRFTPGVTSSVKFSDPSNQV